MKTDSQVGAPRRGARVLFIPEVDDSGTSERSPMVLRTLRQHHDVVGLPAPWDRIIYDPSRPRAPRGLLYVIDKVLLAWRGARLARRNRLTTVFCETAHHAVAGLLIAKVLGLRCVWDSHGNGKQFYESLGRSPRSVRLIAWFERFLGARVDALITVSTVDAAAYADMGVPPSKIHVIPLSVRLDAIDSDAGAPMPVPDGGRPTLLFFGSFGYEPNREALGFVNDTLAPGLQGRGIRCEISVAGRDIPDATYHPLVHAIGFVPNIYACIRSARLCIVPVRHGVGVLTKVLDAMAVGTPLVLSEFAASGIPDIRPGVHAYVAATDEDFIRYVGEALADPEAAGAMARRARQLVERKFDWQAYAGLIDALVDPRIGSATTEVGDARRDHHTQR